VPIPLGAELDAAEIDEVIERSLAELREQQISGPRVTPYVLAKVEEITAGESVSANLALAEQNALVAAEVAVEIATQ